MPLLGSIIAENFFLIFITLLSTLFLLYGCGYTSFVHGRGICNILEKTEESLWQWDLFLLNYSEF